MPENMDNDQTISSKWQAKMSRQFDHPPELGGLKILKYCKFNVEPKTWQCQSGKNMANWQTSSYKIYLFKLVFIPVFAGCWQNATTKLPKIRASKAWKGRYVPFETNIGIANCCEWM